jgi:hypothetical protein
VERGAAGATRRGEAAAMTPSRSDLAACVRAQVEAHRRYTEAKIRYAFALESASAVARMLRGETLNVANALGELTLARAALDETGPKQLTKEPPRDDLP